MRKSPSATAWVALLVVLVTQLSLQRKEPSSLCFLTGADAYAHKVVLAGGTGPLGQLVGAKLGTVSSSTGDDDDDDIGVTVLTRNSFLASAPNRVTEQFGWVGKKYLDQNPQVALRDWDGGDLLDIVGSDWIGWQDDTLKTADVLVHLVGGGFTEQRVMACERLVRESMRINRQALHITVNPMDDELPALSPGMVSTKLQRIQLCEDMVKQNCINHECLRIEGYRLEQSCQRICDVIEAWIKNSSD